MRQASICLCLFVGVWGNSAIGECTGSSCAASDQTTLLQSRVHVALEVEQHTYGPRPIATPVLSYFKSWAAGAIESRLARMLPDEELVPELMEEGQIQEDISETDSSALTADKAAGVLLATAKHECSEKTAALLQATMSSSNFEVLHAELADANNVRHVLLQGRDGEFQYLASYEFPDGLHRALVADPPLCAGVGQPALFENAHDPKAAEEKPTGERDLLSLDDMAVQDCKALFLSTVQENCHKHVTVNVLAAHRQMINGLDIQLTVKVCSDAGECHPHRPECAFETSTDHTDASLIQQESNPLHGARKRLKGTLKLHVPLCDADKADGVDKAATLDIELLEQFSLGENSFNKGFEHVYDSYQAVDALDGVSTGTDVDLRKKHPTCYPPLPGMKAGTETMRNQGTCGSCWAFAGATATMANLCISGDGKDSKKSADDRYEVSVQKIMSCKAKSQSASQVQGCKGGNMYQFDQEAATWGLTKEADNLYKCGGGNPKKHFTQKASSCEAFPWGGECTGSANHNWWWGGAAKLSGETAMMSFIANGQSLYVSLKVYSNFMRINDFTIYSKTGGSKQGGHAINAMGFGVDAGVKYWIIQNSWGPHGWGDQGYARIKRGINLADIESRGPFVSKAWVTGGKQPPCKDGPNAGVSSTGDAPYWSCARAKPHCSYASIAGNCQKTCNTCGKGFNGAGTTNPPSPKPPSNPEPSPNPTPAPPTPKPAPDCNDMNPTTIKMGSRLAKCDQLVPYCKSYAFVRKQCCVTCGGGSPPTSAPTPAPTPAPTEAPTPAPTPAPTEPPTDAPTDAPTEPPTDAPTEAPTDALRKVAEGLTKLEKKVESIADMME